MTDMTDMTENQPTAMRTHLCGVLRDAEVEESGPPVRLGGPAA